MALRIEVGMHGFDSGSAVLVNAEVDSMGGVVDGGAGVGLTSLCQTAIEKAQAELRQEYHVLEQRRRELEFLDKGGNPLDFKFGNITSASVHSTSLTGQHPEQFVTSDAKGSFALTASPRGDSVESSGRPEVHKLCEPNSADNLLLFDGDNDSPEEETKSMHVSKRHKVDPSEQSSHGTQNTKESEDSAIFRPYARRNRSRPNRDGIRSNLTGLQGRSGQGSLLPSRGTLKDHNLVSVTNIKSLKSNGDFSSKLVTFDNQLDMELDGVQVPEISGGSTKGSPESKIDLTDLGSSKESQHVQPSLIDSQDMPIPLVSGRSDERDPLASSILECLPCEATRKIENDMNSVQVNGFTNLNREGRSVTNERQISSAAGSKGLGSDSSSTQASSGLNVNNDTDICTTRIDDNASINETSDIEEAKIPASDEMIVEKNERSAVDSSTMINDSQASAFHCNSEVKVEDEMHESRSEVRNEVKLHENTEGEQRSGCIVSEAVKKLGEVLESCTVIEEENLSSRSQTQGLTMCQLPETIISGIDSTKGSDCQASDDHLKVLDRAHEDSILEEARMIEAKRKWIAELSVSSLPSEDPRKSQWDFVLEEMSWLANDFAQERLWKRTAASQICHQVAFTSQLRREEKQQEWELKKVAQTLTNAVNQFWHSAKALLNGDDLSDCIVKNNLNWSEEPNEGLELQWSKHFPISMQRYAVRFLKYNNTAGPQLQAPAPATPDRVSDLGVTDLSWEDYLTEENLFYAVPSGATETYRRSIESHLVQCERTSMPKEVDTSKYDTGAVSELSQDTPYDDDEGETNSYYFPGDFEGRKSSTYNKKKRKGFKSSKIYGARADLPYEPYTTENQQSILMGKRPASLNAGSIPTKRMRTASRPRVVTPFGAGTTGNVQAQIKTDASSGDTDSYHDDQSTLHNGSQFQNNMEIESVGEHVRHPSYEHAETSMKPKKKKQKHMGLTYDQGWQLDSPTLNDQGGYSKKRDNNHFESKGTIGLYGQHNVKRLKILKQSRDSTYDGMPQMTGSLPSPVASQMSNMTNPSRLIKLIGGQDRVRKAKLLKIPVGQPGSGNPWSQFEDQALVVLVHDMGPNWELISDAINGTLHLKCIFRKPGECKERHKILMDLNTADGADSAEDSGSSQPYPSTIPGIPKGSARHLFQRLQEPMEEETLKSHFERIIKIGKKHHYMSQNDNQDPKQVSTVHNSHVVCLSQVCPNDLNGGSLTPLDLCDVTLSSPDGLSSASQGSQAGGLPMENQGAMVSLLPSGTNVSLQGTSSMVLDSSLSSPSGPFSATVRDGRYSGTRTSAIPVEEQQRMQQYNRMLSSRNIQQSSMSVPGALPGTDHGVQIVPGANGMGMMCGLNRSTITRPGSQGMVSSSNISSSMVGIPSPVNMHSGAGGPANMMLRPHDSHMMRPVHNPEHQRQLMAAELQMQVTHGNDQGIAPFNDLSSGFPSQKISSGGQMYAGPPQQQHQLSPQQSHVLGIPHIQGPNHATVSQQQAYVMRMLKERQLNQQRFLQQQQLAVSNSLGLHVQPQAQLPISSSLQNSSQIQSQSLPHPGSLSPSTASSPLTPLPSQHQQKHIPPHGMTRNPGASGLTNQTGKPRQRPQQHHLQQSGRHHPQQRPIGESQPQTKQSKGMGRGNPMVHQSLSTDPPNISVDPSHLNGFSMPPGSQAMENGEQIMQLMQGQTAYSGSGINPATSNPLVPLPSNNSQLQQKLRSIPVTSSSKHLQQNPSHSDNSTEGETPYVLSVHAISASHQSISPATVSSNPQQLQPLQQKKANQTHVHRVQQNRKGKTEVAITPNSDLALAEKQPVNNTSQVGTSMSIPQSCIGSNVLPVSSTISQWKSSEPVYDSNISDSTAQGGSLRSPSLTNPYGNKKMLPFNQRLGLGNGNISGAHWQQKQLLEKSPSATTPI